MKSSRYIAFFSVGTLSFIVFIGVISSAWIQNPKLALDKHSGNADPFTNHTLPLVKQYCHKCHSTKKKRGELDLERFSDRAKAARLPRVWQKVLEMLGNGEMPPKKSPQLSKDQRNRLVNGIKEFLAAEARARAGDPGRVALRRLNNAEYNYTIRDLTGVDLRPAKEFPADSAAGEGFRNTGDALVMSPALIQKYFDAAKEIAAHAVLLPDGFRFSPKKTRRDWTNELVAKIQTIYARHTVGFTRTEGKLDTDNVGRLLQTSTKDGRVDLGRYISTLIRNRDRLQKDPGAAGPIARVEKLNGNYLRKLAALTASGKPASALLNQVRLRLRKATASDSPAIVSEIGAWQKQLWRFEPVGHFKPWQVPVNPLVEARDFSVKIQPMPGQKEVVLYLIAGDAGDGNVGDQVVWQYPRFEAAGRPRLYLRDVRKHAHFLIAQRQHTLQLTAKYLEAAAQFRKGQPKIGVADLAKRHGLEAGILAGWINLLGAGTEEGIKIESYLMPKVLRSRDYKFIQGWGSGETPILVSNASDQQVRIPGIMKPHSVAMHPSPTLLVAVGWQSPINGNVRIEAKVADAHPECGNGVSWSLELRRGGYRQKLHSGEIPTRGTAKIPVVAGLSMKKGDLLSLLVGPRGRDHTCDMTAVDLVIAETKKNGRAWHLAKDVADDILKGNPHPDRFGNQTVWHFYKEKIGAGGKAPAIPVGSLLANWRDAKNPAQKSKLALQIQKLLNGPPPKNAGHPDANLYQRLTSLNGPLLSNVKIPNKTPSGNPNKSRRAFGLNPAMFDKNNSLIVHAPSVLEIRLPADLVAGREFVVGGLLDPKQSKSGSVQLHVLTEKPSRQTGAIAGVPIVVRDGSAASKRWEKSLDDFRNLFPIAMCYGRIVPVDQVITLVLFHREDDHLSRLMLVKSEKAELDRLWTELRYVSQDAISIHKSFDVFQEFASQEGKVKLYEPLRKPIRKSAEAMQKWLTETEPKHLDALVEFAARAYRRPLAKVEAKGLLALYQKLRSKKLSHDEAFRLTLARILVSSSFLYRLEQPGPGKQPVPVTDWELANRLSYFLWGSMPDAELRQIAAKQELRKPDVLAQQARRLLKHERVRGLATEFACQLLGIHGFDKHEEKSETYFPNFPKLRGDMYEETVRFFVDLFKRDGSILDILDADHVFVNEKLAEHYGITGFKGAKWQRVDNAGKLGRGGILTMATTLSKQSGASRTSPVLRGNWIVETLLGEKLPRPPPNVPQLPADETKTNGLTVRQLVEKHRSIPQCAVCHNRIDPYGFALEGYDAIGRLRKKDLAGRAIDNRVQLKDGTKFAGITGLQKYLLTKRKDEFLRTFCKKLLGYSLGRSVQLSDELLIDEMLSQLRRDDYRISAVVDVIVRSKQFRFIRGKEQKDD